MESNWLLDIIRSLFFFIDEKIYFFVDKIYKLFVDISNTTLFTDEMIDTFVGKVYALVGIFMLFKVSFSILTYIINPDEFADKNKGMGKMIGNIITSLAMLILVPFVFNEAMEIQGIILKNDIIPKIFSTQEITISSASKNEGEKLALITFNTFYASNEKYETLDEIFKTNVNATDKKDNYIRNYDILISTVVGIVMILIFLSFCFDIAVRSVKLGFLRLMAPIPIIGRIDPKKGNELFSKWTKNCISTYLDLFMRLIAIFFALYIIKALTDTGLKNIAGEKVDSVLIEVFIILGALMFAKQLPKLLEDLLGIKLSGTFSLNPLKKLEEVPLAGKPLSSATRFAGRTAATLGGLGVAGAGAGLALAGKGVDNLTGNKISGAGNSIKKFTGDIKNGFNTKVNDFLEKNETLQSAVNRVQRDMSKISSDAQSTLYGAISGIPGTSGLLTAKKEKFDKQIQAYDDFLKKQSDLDSYVEKEIVVKGKLTTPVSFKWKNVNGQSMTSTGNINVLKQQIESLKNSGASATDIANAELAYGAALKQAKIDYINMHNKGSGDEDGAIISALSDMDYIRRSNSSYKGFDVMSEITSGEVWDKSKQEIHKEKNEVTITDEYRAAQNRARSVPKSK